MNLVVPLGNIEFIFYNAKNNNFKRIIIGEDNYSRLIVEPGIWFAFRGISKKINILLNISNIKHDPNESENLDLDSIKYNW